MSVDRISPAILVEEMMREQHTISAAIAVILKNTAVRALAETHTKIRLIPPDKTKSVFSRSSIVPIKEEKLPPHTRDALHDVIGKKQKSSTRRTKKSPHHTTHPQPHTTTPTHTHTEQLEQQQEDTNNDEQQQQDAFAAAAADCSVSTDGTTPPTSAPIRTCDRIEAPVALALHSMDINPHTHTFTSSQVLSIIRSREFLNKLEEAMDV
jgi:hypothetical protein